MSNHNNEDLLTWWNTQEEDPIIDPDLPKPFDIANQPSTRVFAGAGMDVKFKPQAVYDQEEENRKQRKINENKRINDVNFVNQYNGAKQPIMDWLNNPENIANIYGVDVDQYDNVVQWKNILRGYDDQAEGDADAYKKIAKELKKQFGDQNWYGGFEQKEGYENLLERDLDKLIKYGVERKVSEEQNDYKDTEKKRLNSEIVKRAEDPRFNSEGAIVSTYKKYDYLASTPAEQNVMDITKQLKQSMTGETIEDENGNILTPEILQEKLKKAYDELDKSEYGNSVKNLYDWDGNPIETLDKTKDSYEFTEEEINAYKEIIENGGQLTEPTYAAHLGSLYETKLKELALNDFKGEDIYDVVVNDPEAWEVLKEYKTGVVENGFTYSVPMSVLSKKFSQTIATDGDDAGGSSVITGEEQAAAEQGTGQNIITGNNFDSPLGYFGLLENDKKQEFGWLERNFYDEDLFSDKDLSRAFKLKVRDHRDNRRQILLEKEVLRQMATMNIDPTQKLEGQGFKDFMKQGLLKAGEGFKGDLAQWAGFDKVFEKYDEDSYDKVYKRDIYTIRQEKDVVQTLEDTYGGVVTEEMKKRLDRTVGYKTWEGFTGFIPALAEFAAIDVAAKKVGILTGIPKLAGKIGAASRMAGVTRGHGIKKTTNFLLHAMYEEAKMKAAFDEYYHMGGGVAFYSIGKALPFLKSASPTLNNVVNNIGRGGTAGMLSVQGAQNLEALVEDLKGNKTFMSHLEETYFNENDEFKLSDTAQTALVDFLVFGTLGIRGMAKQGGQIRKGYDGLGKIPASLGIAPVRSQVLRGKVWWKGIEQVRNESVAVTKQIKEQVAFLEKQIETPEGNTPEARQRLEKLKADRKKYQELYINSENMLMTAIRYEDWQDPDKATKHVNRVFDNVKTIIDPEGNLEMIAGPEAPKWVSDKDAAAEINAARNRIWINTNKAEPGKLPHEIVHYAFKELIKRNPDVASQLRAELSKVFDQKKMFDMQGNEFFIKDIVEEYKFTEERKGALELEGKTKEQIKAEEKKLLNEEYVAYVFEALANPRNYSRFVTSEKYKDLGKWSEGLMEKFGVDYKIKTKEDLVNFFYSLSQGLSKGKVTQKQWDIFNNIDKQHWLKEPIGSDMRTRKSEAEGFAVETSSKNLQELAKKSKSTQDRFNQLKEKYDGNIDQVLKELLLPDPAKPTTSVSKEFDGIVYNVIDSYNQRMVRKGAPDLQVTDPVDRYMLATELVYDLSRGKNRGLESIIKTYDPAAFGKTEAQYPLTKHVMQQLALRVFEIKEGSLDVGKSGGFDISLSDPDIARNVENKYLSGESFDFRPKESEPAKAFNALNEGIRISEVTKAPSSIKNQDVIDYVKGIKPENYIKDLSFNSIGKAFEKVTEDGLYEAMNVTRDMKPADFVNNFKEAFNNIGEKNAHEFLPKTSNEKFYQPTNINKSIFKSIYTKTNEKFKSNEMPEWSETNARTFKYTKNDYVEGQLENIIFNKRDNVAVKEAAQQFITYISKPKSSQDFREKLNDPMVQDFMKKQAPEAYHKLAFEDIYNSYIKEKIEGATPKGLQSKDLSELAKKEIGVWNKFKQSIRTHNWNDYENTGEAWENLKLKFSTADQKVLDKHWDKISGENGYKISGDVVKNLNDRMKAMQSLGLTAKVKPFVPMSFPDKYVGINREINRILQEKGWDAKDIQRLEFNITDKNGKIKTMTDRVKDPVFNEKFYSEMAEIAKTMDPAIAKLFTNSLGHGQYKTPLLTFEKADYTKEGYLSASHRKRTYDGLGKKEKLDFNPAHVKLTDNVAVKKKHDQLLETIDTSTPAGKKKYAKAMSDFLTKKGITLEQTEIANEKALNYIKGKLFDYYAGSKDKASALSSIHHLLQLQTSIGQGFARGLATHNAGVIDKGMIDPETGKRMYRSEHELQVANFNGNSLVKLLESKTKEDYLKDIGKLTSQYRQSIIPEQLRKIVDNPEFGGNTGLLKGYNSNISAKANFMLNEIVMEKTIDFKTGKSYKQLVEEAVNISTSYKTVNKIKQNLLENLNKRFPGIKSLDLSSPELMKKIAEVNDVITLMGIKGKKRKGLSIFDFDDTLAKSNSRVLVTMPDGKKFKINATEFAKRDAELTEKGAKYDFSEFNKVIQGKKGPLADLALKRQDKFGSGDIFVLTARPQQSAKSIHKFLKSIGLEIPLENITGLENGTPAAKAMWVLNKASKGYNDFYFADDAIKNVKAVKQVLDLIDVKGDVQQAMQSKDLDKLINDMVERKFGIGSQKVYSPSKAQVMGGKSGKFQFMASSAQDFQGLWYRLLGKGKQGDLDKKFFEDNLQKPYNRAENKLSSDRMNMINDFNAMKKQLVKAGIPKDLMKEIPGEPYTIQQAIRVYTWAKSGYEIPNLSKADQKMMVDYVNSKPALARFSQQLINLNGGNGYIKPTESWLAGTITTDLHKNLNENKRAEYLQEWQQNVDIIFSPKNMNKFEAALGSNWRAAMENMLRRMKTGSNRPGPLLSGKAGQMEQKALDWVNNSVGAIMFLNSKSALLQTISTINYVNWTDNNPLQFSKAIANQKQFWKDYAYLMNSDFLVERRGGNRINVAENEIAEAANKNGVEGAISYLLNKGFVLTRAADSHAIASGGAAFYRNRTNRYIKEGMSKAEAEKKAFDDFREITEESQQSSRADRISMQQASHLGRLVLSFANTPSQYARIMQRAADDLKNGRGDAREHISKIAYYGFIQNLMFNGLQNALFRDAFDDNEKIDGDYVRTANGMAESILRGMGWQGAAVNTVRSMMYAAIRESQKERSKYANVGYNIMDMAPPIDSKVSKLRSAGLKLDYEMDQIKEKGFLDPTNPAYMSLGQVVSATTNVPLDRLFIKYNNIEAALREDTEDWQRIALLLGWTEWQLGMLDKDETEDLKDLIREIGERSVGERKIGERAIE